MSIQAFEPFPFPLASDELSASEILARHHTFMPTKRVIHSKEQTTEEEEPPPPTFNEEELEQAKEDAYRKGFDDGEKKGLAHAQSEIAKIEQAALDMLPGIIGNIQSLFAHYNQFVVEHKESLPRLSLAIAQKLYGQLPPEHLLEQVVAHTTTCVETMLGEPELHVYVHPDLSDKTEARLAKHFASSHEPGDVIIHSDSELALSDCRIEWRSGGMEYSHGSIVTQLQQLVEGLSHSVAHNHHDIHTEATEEVEEQPTSDTVAEDSIETQQVTGVVPPTPKGGDSLEDSANTSPTVDNTSENNAPNTNPEQGDSHE